MLLDRDVSATVKPAARFSFIHVLDSQPLFTSTPRLQSMNNSLVYGDLQVGLARTHTFGAR